MRIRTIKPDFWLHEGLADFSAMHRLLFIGLWMLADKAGRLEDRPKRIAAALFPYDPAVNVDQMLADLDETNHVHRYGDGLLSIPGFLEHQRPHPKEAASVHPEPPHRIRRARKAVERLSPAVSFPDGCSSVPSTPVGREGKESQEGKGREGVSETAVADDVAGSFAAWVNDCRAEIGLPPERPIADLPARISPALLELNGDVERLKLGYLEYLHHETKFWALQKPRHPLRGFLSQALDFVPAKAPPPEPPSVCAACGAPATPQGAVFERKLCADDWDRWGDWPKPTAEGVDWSWTFDEFLASRARAA